MLHTYLVNYRKDRMLQKETTVGAASKEEAEEKFRKTHKGSTIITCHLKPKRKK